MSGYNDRAAIARDERLRTRPPVCWCGDDPFFCEHTADHVRHLERDAEACERRMDRSPADQATGGVVHPNGTHIVSQHAGFLAACLRTILGSIEGADADPCDHDWCDEEPWGGGRTFRACSQCGAMQKKRSAA